MKRILIILGFCGIIAACSSEPEKTTETDTVDTNVVVTETPPTETPSTETPSTETPSTETPATEAPATASAGSSNADIAAGKDLIAKNDCLNCHKLNEPLVGPAYAEVAKKYEATDANVEHLAGKVIKGGSGVWGQIPMAPHPTIPEKDVEKMVRYVLSVK